MVVSVTLGFMFYAFVGRMHEAKGQRNSLVICICIYRSIG